MCGTTKALYWTYVMEVAGVEPASEHIYSKFLLMSLGQLGFTKLTKLHIPVSVWNERTLKSSVSSEQIRSFPEQVKPCINVHVGSRLF